MVERLFIAVPRGCVRFVIVVFPDHSPFFLFGAFFCFVVVVVLFVLFDFFIIIKILIERFVSKH